MFVPHLILHQLPRPRGARETRGARGSRPRRAATAAAVAAALAGGVAPLTGQVLEGRGLAVAAAVLIVLLSAGLGFGLARLIGRQGRI